MSLEKTITEDQRQEIMAYAAKYGVNLMGGSESPALNVEQAQIPKVVDNTEHCLKRIELIFIMSEYMEHLSPHSNMKNLELAQLAMLLRKCRSKGTEVLFSATFKGIRQSAKINSRQTISSLSFLVDALLTHESDGFYEHHFNWPLKQSLGVLWEGLPKRYIDIPEPYGDEELEKILQYEGGQISNAETHKGRKNSLSLPLKKMVQNFKDIGVFDNKCKTILTNEACFLYDTLVLLGLLTGYPWSNSQEKYQEIKRLLK